MFCQVCGLKNSDDEEFCARCNSKLLVLSGVGVVEETGEPQEEIPLDEHLLERISTLEDVVKRTAEAVKSLFESLGNLEKNLFVAHTGILALQETLERRGAVRSEEVVDLWESKMDERMQAVERMKMAARGFRMATSLHRGRESDNGPVPGAVDS